MALPTSDMNGYAQLRERVILALDRCQEQQWLDFKESQPWDELKWWLIKTIMAMANLRDGGLIVVGVSERGDTWNLQGVSSSDLSSYDYDDIIDQVTKYASPHIRVDIVLHRHDDGNEYLVFLIHQFTETPVVCKKNSPDGLRERDRFSAGDFFVRPPGKPQTEKVTDASRLHDLLELAAENRARRMLEVAHRVGLVPSESSEQQFDAELLTITEFPVPVTESPYWKVTIRPDLYEEELIPSRSECLRLVEKTRVRLRGWDFPAGTSGESPIVQGGTWIGTSCQFMSTIEFWRFYQSGQFVHWSAVREVTESQWHDKLQQTARRNLSHGQDIDSNAVPGFISIINLLYNVTEIFEFAARIVQAGIYKGDVSVRIELHDVENFVLAADFNRMLRRRYVATENNLVKTWTVKSDELVANSADYSLKAAAWFFESFGWMEPDMDGLKKDQEAFLEGRNR